MEQQADPTDPPHGASAHGMGYELVAPDWPIISLADLGRVFARYPDLARPEILTWHSPRPFSAATIVDTASGPIFVKRHHQSIRSTEGLSEEHRFIAYLRTAGAPVAEMLVNDRGVTVTADGDWVYELHRAGTGVDLYRDALSWSPFQAPAHAFAAGQALAELHQAATGFEAPSRSTPVLVSSFEVLASADLIAAIDAYAASRPALLAYLSERDWRAAVAETCRPFHHRFLPYLDGLKSLWTHNDWHASNLLWHEANGVVSVSMVFDFGLTDRTTPLFDLATAIERNCIRWLDLGLNVSEEGPDLIDWDGLAALLDGYDAVAKLTRSQGKALAALLPIVHIPFALSETDYFLGILKSPDKADLAWDGYLINHARWFASSRGQTLLGWLERRFTSEAAPGWSA